MKPHSIAGKTLLSAVKTQLETISLQESRSNFMVTMFRIFCNLAVENGCDRAFLEIKTPILQG